MQIYDPTAPAQTFDASAIRHPGTLKGKTVAFLDNGWSALHIMYPEFERLLTSEFGAARVSRDLIPLATSAPTAQLVDIANEADFAVVALAN